MNFQQLRSVREAVRHGFNLSDVAVALHTSQPGVSRRIRELESELGVEIFVRCGKRLTGLTPPGQAVLRLVERLLQDADDLRRAGEDFARQGSGTLTIAATHSQARYALPAAVRDFRREHPNVVLHMRQGTAPQVARMLLDGQADIGVATEALTDYPGLLAMPGYAWTHVIVVPRDHALAGGPPPTLADLAALPLITYDTGTTGRTQIDEAFARAGLRMNLVLSAVDADVIKTYVELGLGVGLIASIAFDEQRDQALRAIDARHLFPPHTTRIAVRRGAYLRDFAYRFITLFAPPLTRQAVQQAMGPASAAADTGADIEDAAKPATPRAPGAGGRAADLQTAWAALSA